MVFLPVRSAAAGAAGAADTPDATMADAAVAPAAAAADGTKTTATHASLVDAQKEVEFALVEAALTGGSFDVPVKVEAAISSAPAAAAADTPDAIRSDRAIAAAAAPETAEEAGAALMDATMTHLVETIDPNELRVTLAKAFSDVQAQVESKIARVTNIAGAPAAAAIEKKTGNLSFLLCGRCNY